MAFRELPSLTARQSPPHILCVDDNKDAADSTAMLLRACGYDAEACYDGPEAMRRAERSPPDLCFIDLNMPGMDGDELATNLRKQAPGRPMMLVAVTAMAGPEAVARLSRAGFTVHLVKPADPDMMVNIARCVQGS